mmetsp:Transcript_58470/g.69790  ORF Transcript_58470/g.69790 Transcript_58470/m.69790 type:complete len:323 (+) Transcript_58470:96-1064(+)|eukprot:CAMPEP_0172497510 /NCGR_PEP_ID=MMETSP1066-20121228/100951_1 /TAXON_ID=671091 /ORGANISM="Coscinodiscus wailesii, Strain CCMP2513" /LENGTH=322 /DNA_ID=CAMNT_0013270335 /DNA_START=92 /DNA_END=1060 /DNA_ORIENTATION=+
MNATILRTTLWYQLERVTIQHQHTNKRAVRNYISRAHTHLLRTPVYPITHGLKEVIDETAQRRAKREERWKRWAPYREKARQAGSAKYPPDDPVYRNQDETIEIALNLNLDPRKPGQNIRGSISLPHGTGKQVKLMVFTDQEGDKEVALENGASNVGGEELIQQIKKGEVPIDFDRVLATKKIMPTLSREVARILGPRGLMPSPKLGTVVLTGESLDKKVREQMAGLVNYRADKEGIIHAPVGKASFGYDKLMENINAFMTGIMDAKPDIEGKKLGKKGVKRKKGEGKYLLRAHISTTQGKSWKINVKTMDPGSPFFLGEVV